MSRDAPGTATRPAATALVIHPPIRARAEMARFAVTGVAAYGVDVAVFNMAVLAGIPSLAAKALSSAVALTVAYLGNRYVTWSHGPRCGTGRTVSSFLVISVAAALVQLCFLWASRHVLGLTSVLADNIAANVVGMAAATCLRFWGFRRFVFVGLPADNSAVHTEIKEYPGYAHLLPAQEGWEEIADYALSWALTHAQRAKAGAAGAS